MEPNTTSRRLAIYIHWPFCRAKCPYCDFNSHVRDHVETDQWKKALLSELHHMAALMPNYHVSSIFFGGGTPTLMPPDIAEAMISSVRDHWACDDSLEITLEANPTSVEANTFADFKSAGINRVSLGVQSLYDDALKFLGREHSASEALKAVEHAASLFDRFSFDLIYARPNQSISDWETELRQALKYADAHLSVYQLTIEEQTAFYHAYHNQKAFELPDEDNASELFLTTLSILDDAGLPAYEISNHAKPGEESRHNLSYWQGDAYLGVGPGAHGRPFIDGTWHASSTLKSPERWLENTLAHHHGIEVLEPLTEKARAEEYIMMGLRLAGGINLDHLSARSVLDSAALERFQNQELLTLNGSTLKATHQGWLVLNQLIADIIA